EVERARENRPLERLVRVGKRQHDADAILADHGPCRVALLADEADRLRIEPDRPLQNLRPEHGRKAAYRHRETILTEPARRPGKTGTVQAVPVEAVIVVQMRLICGDGSAAALPLQVAGR